MIWQQLLNGLVMGLGYGLMALGFSMIFGVLRVVNFAHGNVYMLGAFIGLSCAQLCGGNFYISVLGGMLSGALLGLLLERLVFRPVRHMEPMAGLLTSTGALFVLGILGMLIWGASPRSFDVKVPDQVWQLGPVTIYAMQIFMLVAAVIVMAALWLIVEKTSMGIAMRAAAHSTTNAQLMGVDVNAVTQFTLAISSALAGLAGVLVSAYYGVVSSSIGFNAGIKAFTAAVIGGIGSIPGSLLGGILLGMTEGFGSGYLSSGYRDAIAFSILVLVLLIRPTGLFGQSINQKM
ncbi:MAG: branched-chain amino acid ABC transporter permease [Bacillota bacterium]